MAASLSRSPRGKLTQTLFTEGLLVFPGGPGSFLPTLLFYYLVSNARWTRRDHGTSQTSRALSHPKSSGATKDGINPTSWHSVTEPVPSGSAVRLRAVQEKLLSCAGERALEFARIYCKMVRMLSLGPEGVAPSGSLESCPRKGLDGSGFTVMCFV